jgi:aspartyl-tRNA(Asn)/glutamyl-tRNA(Gln) amidotransferase subunit C
MSDRPKADVPSIDRDTVRHVASLARLQFKEADEARLAVELERIVGFVAVLEELDLPAEAPVLAVPTPLRPDEATNRSRVEDMLAGAPDRKDHHLRVPAVMKDKG